MSDTRDPRTSFTQFLIETREASERPAKQALLRPPRAMPAPAGRVHAADMIKFDTASGLKRPLPSATPIKQNPAIAQLDEDAIFKRKWSDFPEPSGKKIKYTYEPTYEECPLCCEEFTSDQFPDIPHANTLEDCRTCFECWGKHFKHELEVKDWEKLGCVQCGTVLTTEEYHVIVGGIRDKAQINATLQRKATDSYLRQKLDNGEYFVTCPSSSCKGGAIMADGHIFTCPNCKARYCFSCNTPMHENMTCEAFLALQKREEEKAKEETLASETLEKHSKGCPKCKVRLQKSTGCDHFTCKMCKHEFCWLCFAPHRGPDGIAGRKGNSAHERSCKYHPNRLPSYQQGRT